MGITIMMVTILILTILILLTEDDDTDDYDTDEYDGDDDDTDQAWEQDFLSKRQFTEEQQHQIRDIRRRGKNKVTQWDKIDKNRVKRHQRMKKGRK